MSFLGVSISQFWICDQRRCKPGFLHGLTVVISTWCVCVCQCVYESVPAWRMNFFFYCGREWNTATCILWFNISLRPQPISKLDGYWWSWFTLHQSHTQHISSLALLSVCLHTFCMIYQSLGLIIKQFVFVFRRHVACCSSTSGVAWRQSLFLSVYGAWAWGDKRLALDQCLYILSIEEKKHFYLRQCHVAVLLSGRCCNSRLNRSFHFRVMLNYESYNNSENSEIKAYCI